MKMIVANWKMQIGRGASVALAKAVAATKSNASVVLCPSFTALDAVGRALSKSNVALGAQDVFWQLVGAYTGEISPLHLGELGVAYVIVGHSERRALGETDAEVNKKVITALSAGLTPIICVGESAVERRAGKTRQVLVRQVKAALKTLHTRAQERLVFTYEPIWAIGSGRPARPVEAIEAHQLIRQTAMLSIKGIRAKQIMVLYGGSVEAKNTDKFLQQTEVDGLLVGGASLNAASLKAIIKLC